MWTDVSSSVPHFLHRVTSEGAPPEALSTEPLPREILHPQSPFIHLSKSSVNEPSSRFPQTGLLWKEMPVSRNFSTYSSGSPGRETSLQVPITEFPKTER